ncbi:hypothetical protein DKG34_40195 [Streptomyces sp. NWU49]|nr:hypothetical protein DKG34_40195 [Streptomyces sp. NWU49]
MREGTISEMLNGKRLPRWETVEPVAWALGGEAAVAACRQRWIEADAARAPAVPAAPAAPHRPDPVPDPPVGPATEPPGTHPVPAETGGRLGSPDRSRRRWPMVAGPAAVAAATLVYVTLLPDREDSPRPGASATAPASRSPSHAAGQHPAGPSPSPSSSPSPLLTPGTALLTAHSSRPAGTPDGLVTISVLSVDGNNIPGAVYSVITPWTSCQVQGGDVGRSVVIKGPSATWIRLVITDFPEPSHTDATSPDFDIPINFQITRGQGAAPRATQKCQ